MSDASSALTSLLTERLISFAQAARLIPPSRNGRPVSPSCIWRWHRSGTRAPDGRVVRLEAAKLINRYVTSEEAIRRFIAAQQPTAEAIQRNPSPVSAPSTRSPERRLRDSEKALHQLREGQR